MSRAAVIAADLIAIAILCFVLYFPRYRRRDMVLAYLGLNIGVLSVAVALSANTSIGTGFGLGLFGTLSIIRLRSAELGQEEIAYYFASLALGLIGGIEVDPLWVSAALPAAIIAVIAIVDHPKLMQGYRHQVITLDRAIADERALLSELERVLGGTVKRMETRKLDFVNDSTVVDVRFQSGTD